MNTLQRLRKARENIDFQPDDALVDFWLAAQNYISKKAWAAGLRGIECIDCNNPRFYGIDGYKCAYCGSRSSLRKSALQKIVVAYNRSLELIDTYTVTNSGQLEKPQLRALEGMEEVADLVQSYLEYEGIEV